MKGARWWIFAVVLVVGGVLTDSALAKAGAYELTKDNVMDVKSFTSSDISLFGVKLGDPEGEAVDILVNEKIAGVRAEVEGTFVLLVDPRKPTGAMAGVRLMDGRVDLIFINNRFAFKTRGVFRSVLNSGNLNEVRRFLGKEDYSDEVATGFALVYEQLGLQVNYLGKDINVEFSFPQ